MEDAIFDCPAEWEPWISPQTRRLRETWELSRQKWGILLMFPETIQAVRRIPFSCECLVVRGDCPSKSLLSVQAKHIITYGLSPRDSLTLSSLQEPLLCVQRSLLRPDGSIIEPQELPLWNLPLPAEQMLPVLGLWLLQMPLTGNAFL